jgi:hypothetical protein
MSAEHRATPRYKAALFLEADCVPLNRDWIWIFSSKWDTFKGKVFVAGRRVESPGIAEHINGNCMVSGNLKFLNWLAKQVGEPADCGWDYCLAGEFRRWGVAELPGMEFIWKTPTMSEDSLNQIRERGVIFLHGIKDNSGLNYARKVLLT